MSGAAKRRKPFYTSVNVDVDIDASVLEDNGYHHEDDCPADEERDFAGDLQTFSDWHDQAHGLTLWANCPYEPCGLLRDEFRSTP